MSCGCKIKKEMSELERVSELARKAAMLDLKADGSYSFDRLGTEIKGTIVEYRHYL